MNKKEIIDLIISKYQSMEYPDFSFVSEAVLSSPYQEVIRQIERSFQVTEDTDPNDDVSFGYLLSKGEKQWLLRISMIEKCAVLFRIYNSNNVEVVSKITQSLSESEIELMSILLNNEIDLMDGETLELQIPMRLFNTATENTRVYQALFTDTDILPWQFQD